MGHTTKQKRFFSQSKRNFWEKKMLSFVCFGLLVTIVSANDLVEIVNYFQSTPTTTLTSDHSPLLKAASEVPGLVFGITNKVKDEAQQQLLQAVDLCFAHNCPSVNWERHCNRLKTDFQRCCQRRHGRNQNVCAGARRLVDRHG